MPIKAIFMIVENSTCLLTLSDLTLSDIKFWQLIFCYLEANKLIKKYAGNIIRKQVYNNQGE